ncbi:cytochrome c oxidase subunit II [Tistrella bauzanensis]
MIGDLFTRWAGEASAHAGQVDLLVLGFTLLVAALSLPVFVLMVVFALRYRRGRAVNRRHPINRNVWIEVSWAIIPFILIVMFFVWATSLYVDIYHPPDDAIEIQVEAKQWMWKFQHPGGQREIDELHVPAGEPVRLTMASQDVIHSLYVPALRLKRDVVPGRYVSMWFTADRPGDYVMTCAEFCGTNHSTMGGRLVVMAPADYARWLAEADVDRSLAAQGAALFRSAGCSGCHGASATVHAPPWPGFMAGRCRWMTALWSPPTISISATAFCCRTRRSPPAIRGSCRPSATFWTKPRCCGSSPISNRSPMIRHPASRPPTTTRRRAAPWSRADDRQDHDHR